MKMLPQNKRIDGNRIKKLSYLFLLINGFFHTGVFAQPELDTTFNSTGKLLVGPNWSGSPSAVVTQPDNKIILSSNCRTINVQSFPFCAVRVNENGTTDSTFGVTPSSSGYVQTNVPGMAADTGGSTDLALQSDGKIVAVGFGKFPTQNRVILIRYLSNGNLDTSFGGTGIITDPAIATSSVPFAVAIQPDGRILIVGYAGTTTFALFVARYNPNGMPDTSFGNNGVATITSPGNSTLGSSISLQPDGKIVTGGYIRTDSGTASYLIARFSSDGTLDTTFAENGLKSIAIGGTTTYSFKSVAIQTDGRILALGNNIIYRVMSDGALDTGFDGDGSRTALPFASESNDMTVTPSGKISVVGLPVLQSGSPIVYRTARYLPNGSPDLAFSNDGYLEINIGTGINGAFVVTTDSRGRIVIGGRGAAGNVQIPWENAIYTAARLIGPTVQNVAFSGRVLNSDGTPVRNAYITLQNGLEIVGNARTNPFGYFLFNNVQSAQTYTVSTRAKGLNFTNRRVLVDDAITNFSIFGNALPVLIQAR